jgi:hypothetical protein
MSVATEKFDPKTLRRFTDGAEYMGQQTGLYPGAQNTIPARHQQDGLRLAATLQPLDANGNPDARNGRIVAVIKGHSNCNQYFAELQAFLGTKTAELNPQALILNAAVGGQQIPQLRELQGKVWDKATELLSQPGLSAKQVQVLFFHPTYHGAKNKDQMPPEVFPEEMQRMRQDLGRILEHCAKIYPNLKIAYVTCDGFRHYTGFEPHVWREAFGVKWMIQDQIERKPGTEFAGAARKIPWLQWGPYIWDNNWDESYFTDGVHPAANARAIFVEKYWNFLRADPIAQKWLLKQTS